MRGTTESGISDSLLVYSIAVSACIDTAALPLPVAQRGASRRRRTSLQLQHRKNNYYSLGRSTCANDVCLRVLLLIDVKSSPAW